MEQHNNAPEAKILGLRRACEHLNRLGGFSPAITVAELERRIAIGEVRAEASNWFYKFDARRLRSDLEAARAAELVGDVA